MNTMRAVDDAILAKCIRGAVSQIVYVAPGVGESVAEALIQTIEARFPSVTIILDHEEDACRIGYGEREALRKLVEAAASAGFQLRWQSGLRIGVLVHDEELVIWAPTANSVEGQRKEDQPNGIVLTGSPTKKVAAAAGAGDDSELNEAEIGRAPVPPGVIQETLKSLASNPPAPFNLSQKARVFSTRFQYVETEVRGAEWTKRKIKLSSLLLNADLPEELQDILDTQVTPFRGESDRSFEVPHLVRGEPAFHGDGRRMMALTTQAGILSSWDEIRAAYLYEVKGFGWLVRRDRLMAFRAAARDYEDALTAWVTAFRKHAKQVEDQLVSRIVDSIKGRIERSARKNELTIDLKAEVQRGLERLRVIEPRVRIVVKEVSWESSRDQEFTEALELALPEEELAGWFEEFTAARQRDGESK